MPLRFRWILANDSDRLRGRDIVARLPIDLVLGLKVFLDHLLASGQTIAATHLPLLGSSNNVMVTDESNVTWIRLCPIQNHIVGVRCCEKSSMSTWTRFTLRLSSGIIRS